MLARSAFLTLLLAVPVATALTVREGFSDPALPGWGVVWYDESPYCDTRNDWAVVEESRLGGSALRIDATCDHAALATTSPAIDTSTQFNLSFRFLTDDPASRGPHLYLRDGGGSDGSADAPLAFDAVPLVGLQRSDPFIGAQFQLVGRNFPVAPFALGTPVEIRVTGRDGTLVGYVNGVEAARIEAAPSLFGRLLLSTSGHWGASTRAWFDDVHLDSAFVPAAVKDLRATSELLEGRVVLEWTPGDGPTPTSYVVLRDGAVIAEMTAPRFTDDELCEARGYEYTVVARNHRGDSPPAHADVFGLPGIADAPGCVLAGSAAPILK